MPSAQIGAHKQQLDTPILCIDLDRMEANIKKISGYCHRHGLQWRPHQKCHKTPAIALKQLNAGAIGVTCAKVSEAEVMAAAGVRDILIANMIVGEQKWQRIAALCRHADPIVACDNIEQVRPLAGICRQHGVAVRVILEINIGLDRVGVNPGSDTLALTKLVNSLDGVRFAGIMGYEGHLLQVAEPEEKERLIRKSIQILADSTKQIQDAGISCGIVSAGGTGSYHYTAQCPGVTELQAGGGIFMDRFYRENCQVKELEYALTVLATVVSRPTPTRAVLDTGRKTMSPEAGMPIVVGHEDATVTRLSAEHCEITLATKSQGLSIGDKLELIVGYGDYTSFLHDEFHGFRGDFLEVVWPILGRGKLQ